MTTYAKSSEVTKRIKTELTKAYPAVTFSVRKQPGSSGAITVEWSDGPTTKQVEEITSKYKSGEFDGMTDSYDWKSANERLSIGGKVYSAMYIFPSRNMTPETETALNKWASEYYDLGPAAKKWDYERMAWRRFVETSYC